MATQMAIKEGEKVKGHSLSDKWWRNFLKQHPEVSMPCTQNFSLVRTSLTRSTIETFYKQLFEMITENDHGSLLLKPHLIFNCDESGFEVDAINKIVAAARGTEHVPKVSNSQHERLLHWRERWQLAIAYSADVHLQKSKWPSTEWRSGRRSKKNLVCWSKVRLDQERSLSLMV